MPSISERIVLTHVRGEVERRLKDSAAPEEIHDFLLRHWARLMTMIFMAKGNQDPDWQAGWDTMNALLWSLAPKSGRKETALMLRALPSLLARLQEGCAALGMPAQERDAFFEGLSMLHAAVARQGLHAAARPGDGGASVGEDLAEEGHVELSKLPQSTSGHAGEDPVSDGMHADLPALDIGARVLLRVGEEDRTMILNWLSPMGGMYLFTNDAGLEALTFTRARLAAKFRAGEARVLRGDAHA